MGVEDDWKADQMAYDGGSADVVEDKPPWQSDVLVNRDEYLELELTRVFTEHGAGRLTDLLMPSHDKPWALEPTPIPELDAMAKGKTPPDVEMGVRQQVEATFAERGFQAAEGSDEFEAAVEDGMRGAAGIASATMESAREAAHKAEVKIEDWHEVGGFAKAVSRVIQTAARLGTGILCGPIATQHRVLEYQGGELKVTEGMVPMSHEVMPWNCFPDPECGANVQDGSFHWERDWIPRRDLQSLRNQDAYIAEAVEACLVEGPMAARDVNVEDGKEGGGPPDGAENANRFEIWYGYLDVSLNELLACGWEGESEEVQGKDASDVVGVRVETVNDRIIRADLADVPPGSDRFPYDYFRWAKRYDDGGDGPWGKGIPRLMAVPQRAINGAYNRIIQNAGFASAPMLEYDSKRVVPADGVAKIEPLKVWKVKSQPGGAGGEGQPAFRVIQIPMMLQELLTWLQVNMQLCEDVTGLQATVSGAAAASAPNTVGGMQLVAGQTGGPIRRLARRFDDDLMEPHIRRYWGYLRVDPNVPDELKGDFVVRARGAGALLEKSMNSDLMRGLGEFSMNPAFGLDPRRVVRQLIKNSGMDYELFMFSDEEFAQAQQEAAAAMEPPPDSAIEVAQIKAQADLEKEGMKGQVEREKIGAEMQVEDKRTERNLQDVAVEEIKVMITDAFNKQKLESQSVDQKEKIKAEIAKFVMQSALKAQTERGVDNP